MCDHLQYPDSFNTPELHSEGPSRACGWHPCGLGPRNGSEATRGPLRAFCGGFWVSPQSKRGPKARFTLSGRLGDGRGAESTMAGRDAEGLAKGNYIECLTKQPESAIIR